MTDDEFIREIKKRVDETLKFGVAAHKRRCANKHDVRESWMLEDRCEHEFDHIKQWCLHCGKTAEEEFCE